VLTEALLRNSRLRHDSPFSPSSSAHANDLGGAKGREAVHQCDADPDFASLAVGVPCSDAFCEGLEIEPVSAADFAENGR